jgi:hypothetical protein
MFILMRKNDQANKGKYKQRQECGIEEHQEVRQSYKNN